MYLSKISIDSTPASIHRLVMRGFPSTDDESPRAKWKILYRIEPNGVILVQSAIAPDWSAVLPPTAVATRPIEHKIADGQQYLFRLALNPVATRERRRYPVTAEEWLAKRSLGADLGVADVDYSVIRDWSNSGHRIKLDLAMVTGYLTVTDCDRLLTVLTDGVGKGRAYGAGMMSVVPAI